MKKNVFSFSGRLGGDPEIKKINDQSLLTCNVAMNTFSNKSEVTTWLRVEIWGKDADYASKVLKKGSLAVFSGELLPQTYTDKNGIEKLSLVVRSSNFLAMAAPSNATAEQTASETSPAPWQEPTPF